MSDPMHRRRTAVARLHPSAPRAATLACALALCALAAAPPAAAQSAAAPAAGPAQLSLPAQPLVQTLGALSRHYGTAIGGEAGLLEGRSAPALQGRLTLEQALDQALAGSGLGFVRSGAAVTVVRTPGTTTTLPTVTVTATAERNETALRQAEGRAEDGYRARTASSVGALGSMQLLDTPFSISVVPQELIENLQAQSVDDIYKLNPSTRTITAQTTGWTPLVAIRGFQTYDTAEDGLRRPTNHAAVSEDKERVEVLNGLSGFLYGAAAPAGMVNYVYKRPTQERLASVTVGNSGGQQAYVHGDFGGRIDPAGRIGYRLNLVRQDGRTTIDDQKIDRTLVSAALDWQLNEQLLLQLNAVYNDYKTQSPSAYWFYGNNVPRGPAPDAARNWSQPWIHDAFENTKLTGKLVYRLNEQITLRGAYTRNDIDRPVQDHSMNSVISATEYRQLRQRAGPTQDRYDAAQALADIGFSTGPVTHRLTLGYHEYRTKSWATSYAPHTGYVGPYPLTNPSDVPEATFPPNTTSPYFSGGAVNRNFVVGDHITFDARWSALVGLNRSEISSRNLNAAGTRTQPDYDQARNSPSLSIVFKPAPALTTYISYIEGLEMGGRAPSTASNNGTTMPPMVSRQKEVGAKAEVGGMLLTAAVFDIEKAYEYLDAGNVYTQNGRQRHKGAEFTGTGKATRALTLLGGVTVLDTDIRGGANDGKEPFNVAKLLAKVYAEYALPWPGLSLTGGIYYTGRQWANAVNASRLPAYTTVDLGVRYATAFAGKPTTLRLTVNNVADRNYWANSYYVGMPRSVAFSAQMQF